MMRLKVESKQIVKYCIVGVFNTAITYITYVVLRWFGVSIVISNIVGYILGLINSFIWNKTWVFQHDGNLLKEISLFFASFLLCYLLQLVVLLCLNGIGVNEYITQIIAMMAYTASNYMFNRFITFTNES